MSDVLLWTSAHGRASVERPTRTYLQQLCADTGCSLEDLRKRWMIETNGEGASGKPCQQHDMIMMMIYTNPSPWAECDTKSIFKQSLTGLNSEFSFSYVGCQTKPSLPCYLTVAGGRIVGFILFSWEMQIAALRIWTRVTLSIFYNSKLYTLNMWDLKGPLKVRG